MFKKPIIVFEGIEGSGKTLHLNNVCKHLKKKKIRFIKLREPGGSLNSEKIRKFVLSKKNNFNKNTDLLLYLAGRSENISIIKNNYKKKVILIDRFIDSTIAYQHFGFGVDLNLINDIHNYLLKGVKIDFTFLNTVSIKNMTNRLKKRQNLNRYDGFKESFYKNVQNGFIKLQKKKKRNSYLIVNSDLPLNYNKSLIIDKIEKLTK